MSDEPIVQGVVQVRQGHFSQVSYEGIPNDAIQTTIDKIRHLMVVWTALVEQMARTNLAKDYDSTMPGIMAESD
eukprot:12907642-Prorocentrum_lima.AAC.1